MEKKLTELQKAFVDEYLKDFNGTQAFIRAREVIGKPHPTAISARVAGAKYLTNPNIQLALKESLKERRERVKISQDWVLKKLIENVEKAMQEVPVLDREGHPTGEYTYQGKVAVMALSLLAKHVGGFSDKLDINVTIIPVINTVIVQVVQLFIQINEIDDPAKRKEIFGSEVKKLLEKQFPDLPKEQNERT